jgi:hypothetical protein
MVAPNSNVVKSEILIGFATNLDSGLGGVLTGRNLSRSSTLPIGTTRVVGTLQMVFTNPIMIIHVNRTVDQPPMSSMVIGGYKSKRRILKIICCNYTIFLSQRRPFY